jgi:hypothetical protein
VFSYIDDVIMATNDQKSLGEVIALTFEAARCSTSPVTNYWRTGCARTLENFDFLGTSCDMVAGTVCPSNKNKGRIAERMGCARTLENFNFLGTSFDIVACTVCPSNKNKGKIHLDR